MQVEVQRDLLLKELAFVGAIFRQQHVGWLSLTASDGALTILSHDYCHLVSSKMPATVASPGTTTIQSQVFSDMVKLLDASQGDVVSLDLTTRGVNLVWGLLKVFFPARPPADTYPSYDSVNSKANADELSRALSLASSCADVRQPNGVALIGIADTGLLVATTDRVRLAEVVFGEKPAFTFAIRSTQLPEVKAIASRGGMVDFEVSPRQIVVRNDGRVSAWPTAVGRFPAYERAFVLPADEKMRLEANTGRMLEALRRVRGADMGDEFTDIAVLIKPSIGEVTLVSWDGDISEAIECSYQGAGTPIACNSAFLRDALRAIETERFEMVCKDEVSPLMFRPIGAVGYQSRCVIMPISRSSQDA